MKKMLLLLASFACFGMLVSCSDETQDFKNVDAQTSYLYVGKVTGAITSTDTSINRPTFPSDNIATVKYTNTPNDNYIDYTLTVTYEYYEDAQTSTTTRKSLSIIIRKIGDKYYQMDEKAKNIDAEVKVDGSLENSEFTISTVTVVDKVVFTSLKFTRS